MDKSRLILILLVTVPLLTLGRLASHEFLLWDDQSAIYLNPRITTPTPQSVAYFWGHPSEGLYIPVTYTVWAGLASIAQLEERDETFNRLNPWVFHAVNVLVHLLSVLVVYQILLLLLGHDWGACIGALIFAVHPVQVEPVAWAAGMKDLLCGLFTLTAVWQYLLYANQARSISEQRHPVESTSALKSKHFWLGTLALLLGMLSKPTAMVAPAIVVVLDRFLLGRPWRQVLLPAGLWLLLAIPLMVVARVAQDVYSIQHTDLWRRPLVAADALAFYVMKLIWPAEHGIDYGRHPALIFEKGWAYWTWIVPAVVTVIVLLLRRRTPVPLAAWLILIIGVAPVLGLTTFQFQYYSTVADHYLYLSMLGVGLLAGWAAMRLWSRPAAIVACGVVIAALAGRSFVQAGTWKNDERFFEHAVRVNPDSFAAWNNLGLVADRQGQWELAKGHFQKSIDLHPEDPIGYENMAFTLWKQRNIDDGIYFAEQAIARWQNRPPDLRPPQDDPLYYLGLIMMELGRPHAAVGYFERALREDPSHAEAAAALANARRIASTQPTTAPTTAPVGEDDKVTR